MDSKIRAQRKAGGGQCCLFGAERRLDTVCCVLRVALTHRAACVAPFTTEHYWQVRAVVRAGRGEGPPHCPRRRRPRALLPLECQGAASGLSSGEGLAACVR